ncbi:MAG: hypothetical protein RIE08_04500 [Acidimicrobiales bacterium]
MRGSASPARPVNARVAVVLPYWDFWEASVGPEFRAERERLLERVVDRVGAVGVDVVWSGMVAGPDEASAAADEVVGVDPEAILVAVSMAVPPTHSTELLDRVDVPVVVWAVQNAETVDDDFDAGSITSLGSTVGTPMLTSVLRRRGRHHDLHVSSLSDPAGAGAVAEFLAGAATATRLARARLARVGSPMAGYDCVDAPDADLEASLGLTVVSVAPVEIRRRYEAVTDVETQERLAAVRTGFRVEEGDDDGLERSVRLAAAMSSLDDDEHIALGAMNCHVPEIRFGDEPGITPCFGLGSETSRGIPWTCTGDVLTAIAMFVARSLGGAALYHEIEAIDFETDEVALANSGEHDLGWCPAGVTPSLGPNAWYSRDPRTGVCVRFELPTGPASLVGFVVAPDDPGGLRLVVAEGEITGRELPRSPTVGGLFRFASAPATDAWRRWASAGVNHHSAAAPGHLARAVAATAGHLGIGFVEV